jgi:hypothetical protein
LPKLNGRHQRRVHENLAFAFAQEPSDSSESQRAQELLQLASGFDLVLDIHDTDNAQDYIGYGPEATTLARQAATTLGYRQAIISSESMLATAAPQVLTPEIAQRPKQAYITTMRKLLVNLVLRNLAQPAPIEGYVHKGAVDTALGASLELLGVMRLYDHLEPLTAVVSQKLGSLGDLFAVG